MQPRDNAEGDSDIEIVTEEITRVYRCPDCKRCYYWKAQYEYHDCSSDSRPNGVHAGSGSDGNVEGSPPVASSASSHGQESSQPGPSSSFRMNVEDEDVAHSSPEEPNGIEMEEDVPNGENATETGSASIPAMGPDDGALPPGPKSAKAKWAKMRLNKEKKIQDCQMKHVETEGSSGKVTPSDGVSVVEIEITPPLQPTSPDMMNGSSNNENERPVTTQMSELNGNESKKRTRADNPNLKDKPFICIHCGKGFTRERTLNSHVRSMHERKQDGFVHGDDFEEEEQDAYQRSRGKARKRSGNGGQGHGSTKENDTSKKRRSSSDSSTKIPGRPITLNDEGIGKGTATVIGGEVDVSVPGNPSARATSIQCGFCRKPFENVEALRKHALEFHRVANLI